MDAGYVSEVCALPHLDPLPEVSRPEEAMVFLPLEIRDWNREHFIVLLLNARHRLLGAKLISVGSLSASIVHPREVFRPAVSASAAGIILSHNHPSGDCEPSPEDLAVTRRLRECGELMGIEVLDHLIMTQDGRYVSLKARGCL